ncbi:acetylornithine transaminase [Thermoleophilia bacterium SCSIO 60948]|nr:acetylornithine transaminase [Thermoleophilia bacterium SCSIO 60948]
MSTYLRSPIEFVRGDGVRVWDSDGNEYLDFFAGLSVSNLGHCHPEIVAAIREQAGLLAGSSNLFYSEPALRLSERLSETSIGGRVFLCNTGTEASECAIKIARKHAHRRGVDRPEVVSLDGGFHGRTIGALSATPRLANEELFGPLPAGFRGVPRDDAEALRGAIGPNTAAVMIEPVQGEAGIFPIADAVLRAAREACDEHGALLIFDEVQAGMGRTGTLWAYEQTGVTPDVMTAAKALGGGLPVGAVVARGEADVLEPGDHGSTFAGGPIAARAALKALELAGDPELLASVREQGERLATGLAALDGVDSVRSRGLMAALVLADGIEAAAVRDAALSNGLVTNVPGPSTIRLLPPLTITAADVDEALDKLGRAIAAGR